MWEPYYFQFYKIDQTNSHFTKTKILISRSHLSKIYKTYILPILEYACELWDDCCIRDTQKLECLQLEAARIVTGVEKYVLWIVRWPMSYNTILNIILVTVRWIQ
jgi:hypothetical protein